MLFELLREKWRPPVLLALLDGAARYSSLNRRIPTVSHTMLTRALRDLEHGGMVRREVFAAVPTKVEYTLTALGRMLAEQLHAIDNWALEHENNLRAILLNLQREAPDEVPAEPNTKAGGD